MHPQFNGMPLGKLTSRKGGVIYLPNKGKRGRMLIGFLPNKESIREARANPMHFHSLEEPASEEPSESGKNVRTLHLRKPLPTEVTSCPAPATRSEAPTRLGW